MFGRVKKVAGMCGSPLERGGGVCSLLQAFTQVHGGEHTSATAPSGTPPLKRGEKKRPGMCGSPLERGGGVCSLRQAFTPLHGGEHTPATTQSGAPPLKRGLKKGFLQIAALMLLSVTAATAQPQFKGLENLFSTPKSYVVGYTKTAPVIDGDITDAAWQQAKWTDDF